MLNILTIVGNVTAKPQLRYTADGKPVANFSIAHNPRTFNKATREWENAETLFMPCTVWGDQAENVAQSVEKGERLLVTGQLKQETYTDNTGETRNSVKLVVEEVGKTLRFGVHDQAENLDSMYKNMQELFNEMDIRALYWLMYLETLVLLTIAKVVVATPNQTTVILLAIALIKFAVTGYVYYSYKKSSE